MLWVAIYSGNEFVVACRQVAMPLQWLAALADQNFGPLERRCRRRANHYILITVDGPLSGGAATLQAGIRQFSAAESSPYVAHWTTQWTYEDLARLEI